jgi:hypothetical protein
MVFRVFGDTLYSTEQLQYSVVQYSTVLTLLDL